MKKITIVVPTYNEKENIEELVNKVFTELKSESINGEVLIVDDNSPDGTGNVADKLAKKYANENKFKVNVLHREKKEGLGRAYIAGFKKALEDNADYIMEMDADFSHNPERLHEFLEKIETHDLVIGSRYIKEGTTTNWEGSRLMLSKFGNIYARFILGLNIKDFTGGYNLFRKEVLNAIDIDNIKSNGYGFQIEVKYRAHKSKFLFVEIPIVFEKRKHGKSKMSKKIIVEAMIMVWKLRFGK